MGNRINDHVHAVSHCIFDRAAFCLPSQLGFMMVKLNEVNSCVGSMCMAGVEIALTLHMRQ
jgi:hypothetical protein